MYYDSTYFLIIIGAIISMAASAGVQSAFRKYSAVSSRSGLTGAEAAVRILQSQGIFDVAVQHVSGSLTDHYDPSTNTLSLSDSVYGSSSLAAVGVAAHECGHALQHARGYAPLAIRAALVPAANIGATLSWPLVLVGLFLSGAGSRILIHAGILLFCAVLLFQIVTLPVEFDASSRALRLLGDNGLMTQDELGGVRSVLKAAALTYVASVAASLLQLLRLLSLGGRRRR